MADPASYDVVLVGGPCDGPPRHDSDGRRVYTYRGDHR